MKRSHYVYQCKDCHTKMIEEDGCDTCVDCTSPSITLIGSLFNGDCEELFPLLTESSIDLVLTDPPYGIRKEEEWDDRDNFIAKVNGWLSEALRVTKSTVIWYCSPNMLPYILRDKEGLFHRQLIWEKPAGSQYSGAFHNNIWYNIESILVFSKDEELTKSYGLKEPFIYANLSARTTAKKQFDHPTVKSLKQTRQLITHYSNLDDTVADFFGGSGTTACACLETSRKFITVEQDEKHYDTIVRRLSNMVNQRSLF